MNLQIKSDHFLENFIGCVRVYNIGKKPRKKKNINIDTLPAYGDVIRNQCPVN